MSKSSAGDRLHPPDSAWGCTRRIAAAASMDGGSFDSVQQPDDERWFGGGDRDGCQSYECAEGRGHGGMVMSGRG